MDIEQFITDLISQLGLKNTEGVKQFFRDWIKHERRAKGKPHGFNPLNTTYDLKSDSGMTKFNYANVRNYSTYQNGLTATVKTLKLNYYKPLIQYLQGINIPLEAVAKSVRTWGTTPFANKISPLPESGKKPSYFMPVFLVLIALTIGLYFYLNQPNNFIV